MMRPGDKLASRSGRSTSSAAMVVRRMEPRLADVTQAVHEVILAQIPELRGDAQLVSLLRASVDGNVSTIFAAIRHKIDVAEVTAPVAAFAYARHLAQHDLAPTALVRAYRLGQHELLRLVFAEVRSGDYDAGTALEVFEETFTATSQYIDWISEQVVEVYRQELERWRESRERIRGERIREVLANPAAHDQDAVAAELGYPLREHSLAVIMWYPRPVLERGELVGMEKFLAGVSKPVRASAPPLFMAQDQITAAAWIPLAGNDVDGAVARLKRAAKAYGTAPSIAIGTPCAGVVGFARSHELAQHAREVALHGPGAESVAVASYDPGVMITAMLLGDASRARTWIREVLRPLAGTSESDATLRHSLQVFLECGASFTAAAPLLHLHTNTVKYRVRKAVERRGRGIDDGRLDVQIALLLCQRLPYLTGVTELDSAS